MCTEAGGPTCTALSYEDSTRRRRFRIESSEGYLPGITNGDGGKQNQIEASEGFVQVL